MQATPGKGEITALETSSLVSRISPAKYFFKGLVGYANDILVFTVSAATAVVLWVLRLPIRMVKWYFTPVKLENYTYEKMIDSCVTISIIEALFLIPLFCYLFRGMLNSDPEWLKLNIFMGFVFMMLGLIIPKVLISDGDSAYLTSGSVLRTLGSVPRKLWQVLADKLIARGKTYEIEGK